MHKGCRLRIQTKVHQCSIVNNIYLLDIYYIYANFLNIYTIKLSMVDDNWSTGL